MSDDFEFKVDESLVDRIDGKIADMNYAVVDFWQDKTGKSKKSLEQSLYLLSSFAMLNSGYFSDVPLQQILGYGMSVMCLEKSSTKRKTVERHHSTLSRGEKISRLGIYALGIFSVTYGGVKLGLALKENNVNGVTEAICNISLGAGWIPYGSAKYIGASPNDPPKKKQADELTEVEKMKYENMLNPLKPVVNANYSK